jgi:hypothetical protein
VQTSIFIARLIGPVFVAGAIGMLVNGAVFRGLIDEFLRSHALIFLSGLLTMTAGMALVLTHNVWTADWRVLVTVLGWLAAIGGAARIIAPQWMVSVGRRVMARTSLNVGAAIWLIGGAALCFFGYVR